MSQGMAAQYVVMGQFSPMNDALLDVVQVVALASYGETEHPSPLLKPIQFCTDQAPSL
jgi:hypothetical protein